MTTALSSLAACLLGDARQAFAAGELGPYRLGLHAGRGPQGQQVVEQVGAFGDQLRPVALDALDERLDGFLAQLLGDLRAAAAEQTGGVGGIGVGALAAVDHDVESIEHMLVATDEAIPALPVERLLP